MSRIVVGYDSDGHKLFRDLGPGHAHLSWTERGSFHGSPVQERPSYEERRVASQQLYREKKKALRGARLES